MLYSHASKSFRRIISFFLNVLVITSMVLGSFSTVIAQSGSDGTTSGSSPAAGSSWITLITSPRWERSRCRLS